MKNSPDTGTRCAAWPCGGLSSSRRVTQCNVSKHFTKFIAITCNLSKHYNWLKCMQVYLDFFSPNKCEHYLHVHVHHDHCSPLYKHECPLCEIVYLHTHLTHVAMRLLYFSNLPRAPPYHTQSKRLINVTWERVKWWIVTLFHIIFRLLCSVHSLTLYFILFPSVSPSSTQPLPQSPPPFSTQTHTHSHSRDCWIRHVSL